MWAEDDLQNYLGREMLLVRTQLKPSLIHGVGVFAAEFIPEGTKIGEWLEGVDLTLPEALVLNMPIIQQETIRWHAYLCHHMYWLNADNMRFFNHSPQPNTRQNSTCDYATKDIRVGEEITCDYYSFDDEADRKLAHGLTGLMI